MCDETSSHTELVSATRHRSTGVGSCNSYCTRTPGDVQFTSVHVFKVRVCSVIVDVYFARQASRRNHN